MSKILDGTIPILGTLFLVVVLMVYLSHVFSKHVATGVFRAAKSKHIKVIDQVMIGQDRCLLIAKVQSRCFLIGVSAQTMSMIAELTPEECEELSSAGINEYENKGKFKDMLIERFTPKSKE